MVKSGQISGTSKLKSEECAKLLPILGAKRMEDGGWRMCDV